MALIRCPQCKLAMTEDEARPGTCPGCSATLPRETPVEVKPTLPPPPVRSAHPLFWAICGTSVVWLVGLGLWLTLQSSSRPRPAETETASTSQREDKFAAPARAPIEEKKPPSEEALPKKEPAREVKEPMPPEAKPINVAKVNKKEEPKQPEPKPAEPKKVEEVKPPVKKPDEAKPDPVPVPMPKVVRKHRFAPLPYLHSDAIKIDGDLAEWTDVPPILLNLVERGRAVVKPVIVPEAQRGYIAYCSKGIVIAVDVIDTSGALENHPKPEKGTWNFWDNDAVEIYIETLNRRPAERGEPSAHQFFAFPFGTQTDEGIGGYESKILRNKARRTEWTVVPLPNGNEAMLRGGRKNLTGWTMEILIPKGALRQADFKPGNSMGFELQIDSGTNAYYFWACDNPAAHVSMRPDQWGEIMFAGSDARIELLDADNKPARSFTAGKPLTFRVTDADVSLDPVMRDKLSVTVRSKSGDVKVVPLRETKLDSGVFVGTMPTRISTGVRAEDVFEVIDGEDVLVDYVDRLRANGDRDVTVRGNFAVKTK